MCIRTLDRSSPPQWGRVIATLAAVVMSQAMTQKIASAQGYPTKFEFGTPATEQEIAAVAIAIPGDGSGLPAGSGDYAKGKAVYESACAACHGADLMGVAGLPNMPAGAQLRLIGGRGTLASKNPVMTVESYWPYATTLFDYVRRAMPFTAPGSLTADDIYAVSAYILAEGKIIDKSTVLDARTLARVEMPNRDGFVPDPRPEVFK
jgi:mono/diheme cytochrome c family protein